MKAIVLEDFGKADVLRLTEVPCPKVRDTDLLVQVKAAGVNRADLLQREGVFGSQNFGDSSLPGLEIAGVVIGIGECVKGFNVGDRVMGIVGGGAYAEVARADSQLMVHMPRSLSFVEGAATMESFVTAWEALSHLGDLKPSQSVLVHAAAGGVGSSVVQAAKAIGATVFATTSEHHIDNVRGLGADFVIDYRRQDFEAVTIDATASRGVDLVVDFVGGNYLARNIWSLAPGGRLVQVGLLSRDDSAILPLDVLLHNRLQVIGTVMKSRTLDEKRAMVARFAAGLLPLIERRMVRPIIGATYPLAQATTAHQRMEAGGVFGKIVLTMDDAGS